MLQAQGRSECYRPKEGLSNSATTLECNAASSTVGSNIDQVTVVVFFVFFLFVCLFGWLVGCGFFALFVCLFLFVWLGFFVCLFVFFTIHAV